MKVVAKATDRARRADRIAEEVKAARRGRAIGRREGGKKGDEK